MTLTPLRVQAAISSLEKAIQAGEGPASSKGRDPRTDYAEGYAAGYSAGWYAAEAKQHSQPTYPYIAAKQI